MEKFNEYVNSDEFYDSLIKQTGDTSQALAIIESMSNMAQPRSEPRMLIYDGLGTGWSNSKFLQRPYHDGNGCTVARSEN